MIGRLVGKVVAEEPDGSLLLDVNGVGYELIAPLGALGRAEHAGDDRVVMCVHTNVRQDALELFGFASPAERTTFRLLLSVQKVGPRLAIALLSALPPEDLAQAINQGDVARLSRVPGIGKKTAERLVLELKDKLPGGRLPATAPRPAAGGQADLVITALTSMGYKLAEAERAVAAVGDRLETESVPSVLRAALAVLTQRRG